jgi:hypothetical protein
MGVSGSMPLHIASGAADQTEAGEIKHAAHGQHPDGDTTPGMNNHTNNNTPVNTEVLWGAVGWWGVVGVTKGRGPMIPEVEVGRRC